MNQSPLNYTGGKYKLLPQLLPLFPDKIHTFVDLFCGGCNVGINVKAKKYIYNDSCSPLINLYSVMKDMEQEAFLEYVFQIIKKYRLSLSNINGYDFYGCNSSDGLGKYNKINYMKLREDFNKQEIHNDYYYIMLYVLIVYAFNNQIRFNSNGMFNLPIGKRDFNLKMENKLTNFISIIEKQKSEFLSNDFRKFNFNKLKQGDFVYADPPYLITCATYNEQGGWTDRDEIDLLNILDELNERGIFFALSNVIESKNKKNTYLYTWLKDNKGYNVHSLSFDYKNSNYQRKKKDSQTKEVLITNY